MKSISIILFIISLFYNEIVPQSISLNSEWKLAIDSAGSASPENINNLFWRSINVPSSWQAVFDDLRYYNGIGWYRKSFDLNTFDQNKAYLLKFNAVDYLTKLWVNGELLGTHEGGYTPFSFDISKAVKQGNNEILLRVLDPRYDPPGTEGIQFQNIPHGKQDWYVQTSGIWQSASIEIKPPVYFTSVHITPSNSGKINVTAALNKAHVKETELALSVISPMGEEVLKTKINFPADKNHSFSINVSNPLLWSFDDPKLYKMELQIADEKRTEIFGFREIETKEKKLYLNGEPFYLIAALDQDFYPESIYTTPSEDYIRDEMTKAKMLGLNMLRCHIKVPDPLYLKVADEVGLLVWYEVPNWSVFTNETGERGASTMDAMLERDWNHPSLVILSLINESWGLDLSQKEQRDWLVSEFDRVKKKAVGRLLVDNSACWGNFHMKTDINDYHTYWAIPEKRENFDNTIKDFALRPDWLFSKYGDSHETGNEPLLISEFGNWGLPKLTGEDPWWFVNDFLDNELVLPKGYNDRFLKYKYDEVFKDYNDLAENSQRAQFQALKYEIEQIRLHPEIQGYVITEFTDINWECNGLLDMWRNYKAYSEDIPMIQQQDVIIPRPVKYNYMINEEAEIKLYLSKYSSRSFDGADLQWSTSYGKSGNFKLPATRRAEVQELQSIVFSVNEPGKTVRINIKITKDDVILAENFSEIFFYHETGIPNISLSMKHNKNLWENFIKAVQNDYSSKDQANTLITNFIDKDLMTEVLLGKEIICLADTNTTFPEDFTIKLTSRDSEWYDGNWASNLNWRKPDHPFFNNINQNKYFGFEIAQSVPKLVLTNLQPGDFTNVIAGMYVGWIQLNSAYIYELKHGKGKIIICTLPVAENYKTDPFARTLLQNMITAK